MMKTLPAAFLLLLISCASASDNNKFSGSVLWKISGNGLEKPSYILGTHHLASIEFLENIKGFEKAFEEAEQIYGELKTADVGEMQMRLMQEAVMPDSITYEELLSEDDYNKLNEGLTSMLGMGLKNLGKFKPGMISSMYSMAMYTRVNPDFNAFTHEATDMYIQRVATAEGKECFGLETIDDQIAALFDAEPVKIQAEQLACSVRHTPEALESLKKLNDYYFNGDLDKMYGLMNHPDDPCPSSEEFKSSLNKNRNDKWLEKIPEIMSEKPTFFAVGALHLAGEVGLLQRLDAMGYTVEAVK